MSLDAVDWVLNCSQSKDVARLVLLAIARHADRHTGEAYPAIKTIARLANCTRETVSNVLPRLVKLGELAVESGNDGKGGRGKVNKYTLIGFVSANAVGTSGDRNSQRQPRKVPMPAGQKVPTPAVESANAVGTNKYEQEQDLEQELTGVGKKDLGKQQQPPYCAREAAAASSEFSDPKTRNDGTESDRADHRRRLAVAGLKPDDLKDFLDWFETDREIKKSSRTLAYLRRVDDEPLAKDVTRFYAERATKEAAKARELQDIADRAAIAEALRHDFEPRSDGQFCKHCWYAAGDWWHVGKPPPKHWRPTNADREKAGLPPIPSRGPRREWLGE